jgi:hypothetical protein
MKNARLLIGALTEDRGVRAQAPLLLALSKADLVPSQGESWFHQQAVQLATFAKSRGVLNVEVLVLAARPLDGTPARGLQELLQWLCTTTDAISSSDPDPVIECSRFFLRELITNNE